MKVRLFMVFVGNLLTLTGCASTAPLEWLREDHADAIAEDLVIAVAERLSPAEGAVYVADMPLRDHFESAIRAHGYAVAAAPENAIPIRGLSERIPPNTWHLGLDVDDGTRIHRLYRIEPTDVHALSAISVTEHFAREAEAANEPATSWHMRALAPVRVQPIEKAPIERDPEPLFNAPTTPAVVPTTPVVPPNLDVPAAAAPVAVRPGSPSCLSPAGVALTFPIGSLNRGVVDALMRCGWRVIDWPTDPTNERLIVDWILTRETTVHVSSVDELRAGLRAAYGLASDVDDETQEISFWLDESP